MPDGRIYYSTDTEVTLPAYSVLQAGGGAVLATTPDGAVYLLAREADPESPAIRRVLSEPKDHPMPDTLATSIVNDHDYIPVDPRQPWGPCGHLVSGERDAEGRPVNAVMCRLSESAHQGTALGGYAAVLERLYAQR